MANIVLLTAAGIGIRAGKTIPKQFFEISGKPLIVHTMENFEKHNEIDKIVVVTLTENVETIKEYAKEYGITKCVKVVIGGKTGFESIRNGVFAVHEMAEDGDILLIHDGNRPLTNKEIISNCIETAQTKGNAITVIPVVEAVYDIKEGTDKLLDRNYLLRVQTPHAATVKKMFNSYKRAEEENLQDRLGFCGLLNEYGEKLNYVYGDEKNIKITYPADFEILEALINMKK